MDNKLSFAMIACILVSMSCDFLPSTPDIPDASSLETMTAATLSAQATNLPSPTPLPRSTPTHDDRFPIVTLTEPAPQPTAVRGEIFFHDEFNQVLGDDWFWIRENPNLWNLVESPGALRINLNPYECAGIPGSFPLHLAPDGDYQLETKVDFTPIINFQLAGLIVYQDDDNFLKLGRAHCEGSPNCIGNGVYFDIKIGGKVSDVNFATRTFNPSRIFLRISKNEDLYTAFFSEDGESWVEVGQHSGPLDPLGVGLVAGQSCSESPAADFDYFTIRQLP